MPWPSARLLPVLACRCRASIQRSARPAQRQGVAEGALLRSVLEQGGGHKDHLARPGSPQSQDLSRVNR